jgi:hypothetical protein
MMEAGEHRIVAERCAEVLDQSGSRNRPKLTSSGA